MSCILSFSGRLLRALIWLALAAGAVQAQTSDEIRQENLSALVEQVAQQPGLTDEARTNFTGQLEVAQQRLDDAERYQARTSELEALAATAPEEAQQLRAALELARDESLAPDGWVPADASLEQLESRITLVEANRNGLAQRRDELRSQLDLWPERRDAIQGRLAELKTRISDNSGALGIPSDTLEDRINSALNGAGLQALKAEQKSLQAELLTHPTRVQADSAESAKVIFELELADQELQALREAAESARAIAAKQELETSAELEAQIMRLAPELQEYAARNRALAEQAQQHAVENDEAVSLGEAIQQQLESIESDYSLMKRRLEVAGRKETLGRVMVQKLNSLPRTENIRRQIRTNNDRVASLSLDYIDADEQLRTVINRRGYSTALLNTLDPGDLEGRELVLQLVEQRRQLTESDRKNLRDLIQNLLNNNEKADNLILVSDEFHQFLVGNLMWVRNFNFLNFDTLVKQAAGFLSPADWRRLPGNLVRGFEYQGWSTALVLLLLLVSALNRPLKSLYDERLAKPALLNAETLANTLLCMGLLALLALPFPLALFIISVLLSALPETTVFNEALAPALRFVSPGLYALLLTREMLSARGIGRRFLKWDARMLEPMRRELRWSGPVILGALLLEMFVLKLDVVASGGPLGAITSATVAISISIVSARLLRESLFKDNASLRLLLRLLVILPVITLLMLALGLLFAAEIYLGAILLTVLLVFATKTFSDVLERALLILRARLERKAKEELRAREAEGEQTELEVEDIVDVESLSEAHDKLLMLIRIGAISAGLWLIWSPGLPAFNMLESVALWQVTDPAGGVRTVNLMDLFVGLFVLVVTGLVTKHLPSLVTVFLLEWVNVSAATRYASSILMQYTVLAIGLSIFLDIVGWDWSQLQWLVAALGVGIGFGLQEIVANFISGIIILFERPVRVGDIISVGGAEGTVKSINARATVLQTFEGKEHLIPNKELITGQVINWSLSESTVRVVIPVGVAYGTDVRQAMDLLLEAAREVPLVLVEPEPMATFEDFGDNSLLLWLRCYVAEERPRAWTELRTLINDKFNAAGIVISFPQRDVHLDTMKPLEIRLASDGDSA